MIDDVPFMVRGYLSDGCLIDFHCSGGNEDIAQAMAIRYWSGTLDMDISPFEGWTISEDIDWELSPFKPEDGYTAWLQDRWRGEAWRVDIMTHNDDAEWFVSEVKEYDGPRVEDEVDDQLDRYFDMLNEAARAAGVEPEIDPDDSFTSAGGGTGLIGVFQGKPDWRGDQDPYVVWSPKPGHIYFDKLDRIENRADRYRSNPFWEQLAADASRLVQHGNDVNGWPGSDAPTIGGFTIEPPVRVPVGAGL